MAEVDSMLTLSACVCKPEFVSFVSRTDQVSLEEALKAL